jgi:hypothetical protein
MGQVPDDLNEIPGVEAEIDTLRVRTQSIVAELERRLRGRATRARQIVDRARGTIERLRAAGDVRLQLREHPGIAIGVGTAAAAALGVGIYFIVTRQLERRKPVNRLRARLAAYRALLADPERALRPREPLGRRLLAATLIAGATTLVRGLTTMLIKRRLQPMLPPRAELQF